jgi:hypothetical protein
MEREASIAKGCPADVHIENDTHWKAMDAVDKAIVFGFHAKHLGLVVPNQVVADYVAEHPEKLIGFACLDPFESDYLDEMHRVFDGGLFKGLKLAPIYQNYHPCDERMTPVYEYCEKRGIPVLFHQGTTFPRRAPLKYAFPAQLEDVAMAHPDLMMVIAHMGHPWVEDTVVLIRKQPNIYSDVSALYYRPWQYYNALMLAQEYGCAHKLLFGTDYPFTTAVDSVNGLKNINHIIGTSGLPAITDKTIGGILERDTLKLLNLS